MLLCKAALSASWLRAIKFSFYSCRVTFGTSTTAFPSQESWTQATLMSVRRLEKRCVKFNLTSYGRSNHAKMCIFIIWPTDRKGWAYQRLLTSQPATNTRRNCVCVWFFILSLFHVQTQSSFTQREKKKNQNLSVHTAWQRVRSIFPRFPHSVCCSSWTSAWYAVVLHQRPTGAGSTSKLSNRVNHSCGIL